MGSLRSGVSSSGGTCGLIGGNGKDGSGDESEFDGGEGVPLPLLMAVTT